MSIPSRHEAFKYISKLRVFFQSKSTSSNASLQHLQLLENEIENELLKQAKISEFF